MHLCAELIAASMMLEPLGEVGANFPLQLSSRTQFTKINNKKIIAENKCEKHKKSSFFFFKDKPVYQLTHTTAAKFRDECLFCYFELILFVCIDVLRRCKHFCSHDATFPCPPRLNKYLAENKVSCLGHYKVLSVNLLKIAIL